MSGSGLGELFAIPFVLAGAAVYVAGLAVFGTVKGAVTLTKKIHSAHERREEERREERRRALEALDGAMAAEALRRHDAMAAAEKAADAAAWAAREAALDSLEKAEKSIAGAMTGTEDAVEEMRAFLAETERSAEADVDRQTEAFRVTMEEKAEGWRSAVREAVQRDSRALAERVDRAGDRLEERRERYETYARERCSEARALLGALERGYDCAALAAADHKRAQVALQMLENLIGEGSWAAAATQAAVASQTVQLLHIRLEQNEAVYQRARQDMEIAAADLEHAVEHSRVMLDEDTDEAFSYYVDEECDADYWSEGELSRLWREAREVTEQLRSFTPDDVALARQRLLRARRLHVAIASAQERARQHVVSRAALEDLMGHVVDGMQDNGWEVTGEPEFVMVDPATGCYEAVDDTRGDLRLRFEKGGDVRTVVLHNSYDPEKRLYLQQILRFCDEAGTPDENERAIEDAGLNRALRAAGVPEEALVSCDAATRGRKSRG